MNSDQYDRLADKLYAAVISDVLDAAGRRNQVLDARMTCPDIMPRSSFPKPLPPSLLRHLSRRPEVPDYGKVMCDALLTECPASRNLLRVIRS